MACDVQVAFGVPHSVNNFELDVPKLACDGFDSSEIPVVINPLVSQPMAEMELLWRTSIRSFTNGPVIQLAMDTYTKMQTHPHRNNRCLVINEAEFHGAFELN